MSCPRAFDKFSSITTFQHHADRWQTIIPVRTKVLPPLQSVYDSSRIQRLCLHSILSWTYTLQQCRWTRYVAFQSISRDGVLVLIDEQEPFFGQPKDDTEGRYGEERENDYDCFRSQLCEGHWRDMRRTGSCPC